MPQEAIDAMYMPELDIASKLVGDFDYIHLFVLSQEAFHTELGRLKSYLRSKGMLWVSWPKSGQLNTDLSLTKVIKIGYDYGLVESKCLSINAVWSALKFTHPKEGKTYNNSYGVLKST